MGLSVDVRMWLHILPLLLLPTTSHSQKVTRTCDEFTEAACELTETNIVGHNMVTNTPGECQVLCKEEPRCTWFTQFANQCYLLYKCGNSDICHGCVSGPTSPPFDTCPWPPAPTSLGPTTTTTIRTTSTTTTMRTTTTTQPKTTSTTTTTKKTTTTTNVCDNFYRDSYCNWDPQYLIIWFPQVSKESRCQNLCRNIGGAKYFSYYREGLIIGHGPCGCFYECDRPNTGYCKTYCHNQEVFGEEFLDEVVDTELELGSSELFGGEEEIPPPTLGRCHCVYGRLYPDVDSCDLWP